MNDENIGFIGLGNLGKNLANSIVISNYNLFVYDIKKSTSKNLINKGAIWCENIQKLMKNCSVIITCLPNPKSVSNVMDSKKGIIDNTNSKHLIIECSTNDEEEIIRYSKILKKKSAKYLEAPLTGGEWKSKKGNISVLASGEKNSFKRALPILKEIGYQIIYVSKKYGSASTVKVLTNYLASINLITIGEVFMICKKYGLDLKSVYQSIKASSGNSFVHTSEGQLILSRSMDAKFTLDLICKDLKIAEKLRKKYSVPSKLMPTTLNLFNEGKKKLGHKEFSTAIVKLLEQKCNEILKSSGFPKILVDNDPRRKGYQIKT